MQELVSVGGSHRLPSPSTYLSFPLSVGLGWAGRGGDAESRENCREAKEDKVSGKKRGRMRKATWGL